MQTAGVGIPLHWFHFMSPAPVEGLAEDGLPRPVDGLEAPHRRVWASSHVTAFHLIDYGVAAERRSSVTGRVEMPMAGGTGGSGWVIETIHTLSQYGRVCLCETEKSVHVPLECGHVPPTASTPRIKWRWRDDLMPSSFLLFYCSALMMNAHRIHYDRAFARGVEGYEDLVVNGHLCAVLACNAAMARRPRQVITDLQCRALRPLIVDDPASIVGLDDGDAALVAIYASDGAAAFTARVMFAAQNDS